MDHHQASGSLSRRRAIASLGVGGLALASHRMTASSQESGEAQPDHPYAGAWLATVPSAPGIPPVTNVTLATSDGYVINAAPVARSSPQGVTIASSAIGTWEPTGDRSAHFTMILLLSSPDGAFAGTVTIDGHPTVSDDGQSFVDDSPESTSTIRDPSGAVVNVIEGARATDPVIGVRVGNAFPAPPTATPQASMAGKRDLP